MNTMSAIKSEKITRIQSEILPVFQSRSQTKAYYNRISKVYDLLANHSEASVRRAGLEKLAAKPGEKILEIGFGTGHCLVDLARAVSSNGRVYGIDLSEGMLELAQKLLDREGLSSRLELNCADAAKLPYHDCTVEAIFMSFTLELFDTPEIPKVLRECMRVLKFGGRIVVVGMSKEGQDGLMVKAFEWTHQHFPNFVDCRPIYVRKSLENAGFKVTDTVKKHMWVPVEIVLGVKK